MQIGFASLSSTQVASAEVFAAAVDTNQRFSFDELRI